MTRRLSRHPTACPEYPEVEQSRSQTSHEHVPGASPPNALSPTTRPLHHRLRPQTCTRGPRIVRKQRHVAGSRPNPSLSRIRAYGLEAHGGDGLVGASTRDYADVLAAMEAFSKVRYGSIAAVIRILPTEPPMNHN